MYVCRSFPYNGKDMYECVKKNIFYIAGLTTVLLRDLSWNPAFNESLLSTQEIYRGVLKRGTVETVLSAGNEDICTFKVNCYELVYHY